MRNILQFSVKDGDPFFQKEIGFTPIKNDIIYYHTTDLERELHPSFPEEIEGVFEGERWVCLNDGYILWMIECDESKDIVHEYCVV